MYLLVSDSFNENEHFSIIMSIIKAINDAIIIRNDIISTLTVLQYRSEIMANNDRSNY